MTSNALTRLRFALLVSICLLSGLAGQAQNSAPAPPAGQTPVPQGQTPVPPAAATAQDQAGDQGPVQTLRIGANLVDLVFTVTDKHGRFITGLKRENFGLLDDGRPPSRVVSFTQQTNLPLRIGLMIDTSNSIRTRFKFEQDAAQDFILQVLHPGDKAFVEGFTTEVQVAQDFTGNLSNLDAGIRKLRPGGGTSLFDALYSTCKDEMLTLKEDSPVRKAIVLVSDGEDNYSRSLESDAIKMCQRAETIVYAISTDTSPTRGHGGEVLQTITEATGGKVFFPEKMEDVALGFHDIEEELRSQYSLEYQPAQFRQDGSFRTIYLQATDGKYHVRVKKGYFATLAPK